MNAATDAPSADARSAPTRRYALVVAIILLLAGVWRVALAELMPSISRDGVKFCWQARALGERGLDALRSAEFDQHPLFPLAVLGVQRLAAALGAPDSPLTWQRSGQLVALLSGLLLIGLTGVATARLVRRLELPVATRRAGLYAMIFAAVLPLNAWLSVDVMSDELHLALYLGAVAFLLGLSGWRAALGCGLLSGLAFLTRPEGAVVCGAAGIVLLTQLRAVPRGRVLGRIAALLGGFLICAGPYIAASGGLSPKLDKQTLEEFQAALFGVPNRAAADGPSSRAALVREDVAWYAAAPIALIETLRAGRVVVPLLALAPLLQLRRRARSEPMSGLLLCMAVHFALTSYLLYRHGYLRPRHTLVVVMLLAPLAAIFVDHLTATLRARRHRLIAFLFVAVCFVPPAVRSLGIPNAADAFIPDGVAWLREQGAAGATLVGGSSQSRLAFYAEMRFQPWPENEPTRERRLAELRRHILLTPADYFAIETGCVDERAGNAELLEALRADEAIAAHIRAAEKIDIPHGDHTDALHIWSFRW